jgi:hypothetical protein
MEAISSYAFRFGFTGGVGGRADGNMVSNFRIEGLPTCVVPKFDGAANQNLLTNYYATTTSSVMFDNQSSGYFNYCKPMGILYVANYYIDNIPANAETSFTPFGAGNQGGVYIPVNCVPYSMHVTANNYAGGVSNAATVKFYRGVTVNPNLEFTISNSALFGGRAIQAAPDATQLYNRFDGENGNAIVTVTTGADWNSLTTGINVQVVFLG